MNRPKESFGKDRDAHLSQRAKKNQEDEVGCKELNMT